MNILKGIGIAVVVVIVLSISVLFLFVEIKASALADEQLDNYKKAEESACYKAWVKETGNPKDLTQEEFIILYVHRSGWDKRIYKIESKVKAGVE